MPNLARHRRKYLLPRARLALSPRAPLAVGTLGAALLCGPSLRRAERDFAGQSVAARAQAFRFALRAEPDIIAANGISTTSITVQVPNAGGAITASPTVRFLTSSGSIEPQARVVGGVARALLRSSSTPGTAIVTAIINGQREQITVEFSSDQISAARYLQVDGAYVAYNAVGATITASGRCALDYGDLRIESDVRMDVDLQGDRVWAQGSRNGVVIRNRKDGRVHELRGDRLYLDIARRRGVMRRIDRSQGPSRQEFMDADFRPLPALARSGAASTSGAPAAIAPAGEAAARTTDAERSESARPVIVPAQPIEPSSPAPGAPATEPAPPAEAEATPAPQVLGGAAPAITTPSALPNLTPGARPSTSGLRQVAPDAPLLTAEEPGTTPEATATPAPFETNPKPIRGTGAAPSTSGVTLGGRVPLAGAEAGGLFARPAGAEPGEEGKPDPNSAPLQAVPDYEPLGSDVTAPPATGVDEGGPAIRPAVEPVRVDEQIAEPEPPASRGHSGYWVTARKIRVFTRDKIQFEKAAVYFNGRKLFSMPRYVTALDGSFNPATDILAFNSSGGVTLNFPYYYQTSPSGTGTVYIQHAPRNGFAAESPGFALALDQEYAFGDKSQGRLLIDQIGRAWNLSWQHDHQFSPTMRAAVYVDAPRHKNIFGRATLVKDTTRAQFGFEVLMSRLSSEIGAGDAQAQFYARLRPRTIGRGWSYSVGANLIAVRRFALLSGGGTGTGTGSGTGTGGTGTGGGTGGRPGGISIPGQGPRRLEGARPSTLRALGAMRAAEATATDATTTRVSAGFTVGQTLLATLQAPSRKLWSGANLSASLGATAFNYAGDRRGVSPTLSLGVQQSLGRLGGLSLDYSYDRGALATIAGLQAGGGSNFLTGNLYLNLGNRVGASGYFTRSLSDGGTYGAATLDYFPLPKWRLGAFSDYSQFDGIESFVDYGLSLGRRIGQREVTINWSRNRGKVYFELGSPSY